MNKFYKFVWSITGILLVIAITGACQDTRQVKNYYNKINDEYCNPLLQLAQTHTDTMVVLASVPETFHGTVNCFTVRQRMF